MILPPTKVLENIFWVGAVDWNVRHFHGFSYSTHRGTTYNAYLIIDKKIALVDTVSHPFSREMIEKIKEIIDPSKIDYIIANHVESDHSGAIKDILKLAPNATIVGTESCKAGLEKHYFGNWKFQTVKTGDTLNLGERTLTFLEARMLHWPDSMFTYIEKDALLLSNDGFGQHLASSKRFDDEVDQDILMWEAGKYYANILWLYSALVLKKIEEVQKLGLKIEMIAPSHGMIWRKDPMKIITAYLKWAKGEADKKVIIVYDTMWKSTEKMAKAILDGIVSEGLEATLYRFPCSDNGDIIGEFLETKAILVGSSTINNGVLPTVSPFLREMEGLRPKNKIAAVFGSYGWGGGATATIEKSLKLSGMDLVAPALTTKWVPNKEELQKCYEFGQEFAKKVKASS
ncbi:MAG: flavodoxin domain-containing protein [Candidatus Bathyarchaeota archaeon]|nr:flavodoxin domain-containing protein [Candidatus Bathyarchaeum tardum]WGM90498.1 MAG: flavodoxin domain-containing protein [Candidatus Bathyarchaeum tardum]WNZ29434.1 MAG: flavodoxin domain-containing protein [Candidatus Bathyarchaeota archaeon]